MAHLPNYQKAFIDPIKIRDYILSDSHPIGRFKSVFFHKMGYTQENWKQLTDDIANNHLQIEAEPLEKTRYGQKYAITGLIKCPDGKIVLLRSIWIMLNSEDFPPFYNNLS